VVTALRDPGGMNITIPAALCHRCGLDAALLILERMGLSRDDLTAAPAPAAQLRSPANGASSDAA
jgi:hypothetical protein